jgi:hypothetical protein
MSKDPHGKVTFGTDNRSALEAKFEAQKIAFGPIMFQAARALRDLGILQQVRDSRKEGITIEEVAGKLGLSAYGVKVLLEAGLSMELVWAEEGRFRITKTGWHILKDDLTRVNMDFTQDVTYLGMFTLDESVRTGKPTGLKTLGEWETIYQGMFRMPARARESWLAFDHFYSDYSFSEILPIVLQPGVRQVLDVGGNTGKFAIQCAGYRDDIRVTILDLPDQVEQAGKRIGELGLNDRIRTRAMDLLDHSVKFPGGMDVIWMSQFLDCFSTEDIAQLLRRTREAMGPGARLYILELLWDRQRYPASTYSLHATSLYFTNIANGCSQMYHSSDLEGLIENAGMEIEECHENIGVSHSLYKCRIRP